MTEVRFAFGKNGIAIALPEDPKYELIERRTALAVARCRSGSPGRGTVATGACSREEDRCDLGLRHHPPGSEPTAVAAAAAPSARGGIPAEGVTILIATGLHRAATLDEIDTIVGPQIASTYRVVNHDARVAEEQRFLGSTHSGTPVYIDERYVSAELHLSLGFIGPHLMLGFSGGRKLVAPGVAGEQTIKVIHSPKFMREPKAAEGSIADNPLHAELLEIARMVRHDFMPDVTLTHGRQISGVFAGEPVAAHAAGVEFLRWTSLEKLTGLADLVITSAAGHPLDLTFLSDHQGRHGSAAYCVKPGVENPDAGRVDGGHRLTGVC